MHHQGISDQISPFKYYIYFIGLPIGLQPKEPLLEINQGII